MPMNDTREGGHQDDDQDPSDLPELGNLLAVGATSDEVRAKGIALQGLFRRAVRDAVLDHIQAGNSVTGVVDGVVQTLSASDPRLANLLRAGDSDTTS